MIVTGSYGREIIILSTNIKDIYGLYLIIIWCIYVHICEDYALFLYV